MTYGIPQTSHVASAPAISVCLSVCPPVCAFVRLSYTVSPCRSDIFSGQTISAQGVKKPLRHTRPYFRRYYQFADRPGFRRRTPRNSDVLNTQYLYVTSIRSNGQAIIFCSCGFFFLLFSSPISAVADWMSIPYFHTWCGLSVNNRMQVWNVLRAARWNTGRKSSPKIRHLRTIAQLCRPICSKLSCGSIILKNFRVARNHVWNEIKLF